MSDESQRFLSDLQTTIVDYFRSTEQGKALEQEYIKQYTQEKINDPFILLILIAAIVVIVYPYLK